MKKLIAAALLSPVIAFAANGPWDGIYNCALVGGLSSQTYVTLNGQPTGQTYFAVAAIAPTQGFYGYGQGQITGASFAGTTMFGAPFSFTATPFGFTGTIGVLSGGGIINMSASCSKIW